MIIMKLTNCIDCFLLDLDGTVYLGGKLIDGAKEALARMKAQGKVIFLTNNSSATRRHYVDKLNRLGIEATEENVYTSANATADWLMANKPKAKVYLLASPEVTEEFICAGVNVTQEDPDTVVLTYDKSLTYDKLVRACKLIAGGAYYIATHPDMTCPSEDGYLPDIGSTILLIEGTTGIRPHLICGKPHKVMAECILSRTGASPSRTAMVGDRLYTDMRFGIDSGIRSVLTLTGETDMAAYLSSGIKVDKVINSIAEWDL